METPTTSRGAQVLKWSLIVGIVIVLNLFYNYTLSLVFSSPSYEKFCPVKQVMIAPENQEQCISSGGAWTEYPKSPKESGPIGYCDQSYLCNQKYQDAQKVYDKNVFISLVVLGVITFGVSIFLAGFDAVSIALSIGAVLDFVIASVRYWSRADDLIKVFILGVALVVLVWIAIKKFNIKTEEDVNKA